MSEKWDSLYRKLSVGGGRWVLGRDSGMPVVDGNSDLSSIEIKSVKSPRWVLPSFLAIVAGLIVCWAYTSGFGGNKFIIKNVGRTDTEFITVKTRDGNTIEVGVIKVGKVCESKFATRGETDLQVRFGLDDPPFFVVAGGYFDRTTSNILYLEVDGRNISVVK